MIAPTQIRKPENWQDFEKLCKKLWGEIWDCSDTIQRNGRNGQKQCGVDVYGIPKGESAYYGIQCKGKDDYSHSLMTKSEIDNEIKKALSFEPPLKRLIFATTANKDSEIEAYVRLKNVEHKAKNLFEVYISSWEDIVDLLEERRETFNWYINNCQYKDLTDVSVSFNGSEEYEINPEYIRTTTTYVKKERIKSSFDMMFGSLSIETQKKLEELRQIKESNYNYLKILNGGPRKTNYTWCEIPFFLENIGSTTIEDYVIYIGIDPEKIEELDDGFYYLDNWIMDQTVLATINAERSSKRELFKENSYTIKYEPKKKVLVRSHFKNFSIKIIPKQGVDEIEARWVLLSRNYKKSGKLTINVVPKIEDKEKVIEVYEISEYKEPTVKIEPKIVED